MEATEGVIIVEMVPESDRYGSLFLPDNVAGAERSDIGRVISSGFPGVSCGDLVACSPYDGTSRTEFQVGDVGPVPVVKFFGVYCGVGDDPLKFSVDESVLCVVEEDGSLKPTGSNLIIDVERVKDTTDSGIYLPDESKWRTNIGTVVAVGPEVKEIRVGDRVIYHPMAPMFDFQGEIPETWGVVRESGIEAIIR